MSFTPSFSCLPSAPFPGKRRKTKIRQIGDRCRKGYRAGGEGVAAGGRSPQGSPRCWRTCRSISGRPSRRTPGHARRSRVHRGHRRRHRRHRRGRRRAGHRCRHRRRRRRSCPTERQLLAIKLRFSNVLLRFSTADPTASWLPACICNSISTTRSRDVLRAAGYCSHRCTRTRVRGRITGWRLVRTHAAGAARVLPRPATPRPLGAALLAGRRSARSVACSALSLLASQIGPQRPSTSGI